MATLPTSQLYFTPKSRVSYALNLSVCVCVCAHVLSGVWLFVTPWTVYGIFQTRILKWVAISWDLPNPGIEPVSLASPALAGIFFTTVPPGKPQSRVVAEKLPVPLLKKVGNLA